MKFELIFSEIRRFCIFVLNRMLSFKTAKVAMGLEDAKWFVQDAPVNLIAIELTENFCLELQIVYNDDVLIS